jgi:hypothetical protein
LWWNIIFRPCRNLQLLVVWVERAFLKTVGKYEYTMYVSWVSISFCSKLHLERTGEFQVSTIFSCFWSQKPIALIVGSHQAIFRIAQRLPPASSSPCFHNVFVSSYRSTLKMFSFFKIFKVQTNRASIFNADILQESRYPETNGLPCVFSQERNICSTSVA